MSSSRLEAEEKGVEHGGETVSTATINLREKSGEGKLLKALIVWHTAARENAVRRPFSDLLLAYGGHGIQGADRPCRLWAWLKV